ncbi:MAG: hypothetical protein IT198_15310 [Acidimicrobiia bacterium]|nr:hypothetical protein [Acidimicrobiia bacterium]
MIAAVLVALSIGSTGLAACGGGDSASDTTASVATVAPVVDPGDNGNYDPKIDPADFVERIDNPYILMTPGARWVYEGGGDGEKEVVEVVVTPERREVMGVSTVVVRDTVKIDGEVVEDTYDWFAQDRAGNVWYFGEDSNDYDNGKLVSTAGSWEAGVDGALPGIVMPATPEVGAVYRQEFHRGEAEDMFEIVRIDAEVSVPFGTFGGVVQTRDWTPLEPDVVEEKYYAAGVGKILEEHVAGGSGRVALVEYTPGT